MGGGGGGGVKISFNFKYLPCLYILFTVHNTYTCIIMKIIVTAYMYKCTTHNVLAYHDRKENGNGLDHFYHPQYGKRHDLEEGEEVNTFDWHVT